MLRAKPKLTNVQPAVRDVVQLVGATPPNLGEHNQPVAIEHALCAHSADHTRYVSSERGLATVTTTHVESAVTVKSADFASADST